MSSVNEPLLRQVYELVKAEDAKGSDGRWSQSGWRDVKQGRCGTSMCFAGWAVQLTGMRYVVPESRVHEADRLGLHGILPWVVVSGDEARQMLDADEYGAIFALRDWHKRQDVELLDPSLLEDLPEDPHVAHVSTAALWKLRIGLDPLGLFDGTRDLDDIRRRVNTYIRVGPNADLEDIEGKDLSGILAPLAHEGSD